MSIAAKVCKDIRETGFSGAAAARFFNTHIIKTGYELAGEPCAVAQYADGSIAAYFPGRADKEARVLRASEKQAAQAYLKREKG